MSSGSCYGGETCESRNPELPVVRQTPRKCAASKTSPDPDIFVLWDRAGKKFVANSNLQTKRNGCCRADHKGGFIEDSTLRAALVGVASLKPSVNDEMSSASSFQGTWKSRVDGEMRGRIEGTYLTWGDGSQTRLKVVQAHASPGPGDVITMTVDGQMHAGVLSEDGHILRWGDGDRWLRVDDQYYRMQSYCESDRSNGMKAPLRLQGWSVNEKCMLKRPESRSRPGTTLSRPLYSLDDRSSHMATRKSSPRVEGGRTMQSRNLQSRHEFSKPSTPDFRVRPSTR